MFKLSEFDYYLPAKLIAQQPARPRDHSRLLLLDHKTGEIQHRHFFDLPGYLSQGDVLVLNDSKVFPARLIGHKSDTGGKIEVFLHRPKAAGSSDEAEESSDLSAHWPDNVWECLVRGKVKSGTIIIFSQPGKKKPRLSARIEGSNAEGTWQVRFDRSGERFWKSVNEIGEVPLPPYIKRSEPCASDQTNYQTVFANSHKRGSVAAPTAGLHFTKSLLKKIKAQGVEILYVTLHVGLGTFTPVKVDDIRKHKMHSELASINADVLRKIKLAKQNGRRIVAVGTTSCRVLESLDWDYLKSISADKIRQQTFWTDIFIYPGYQFKAVDALITNFHLPKSTLLMLVSSLAGRQNIKNAYQTAVAQNYRFFSYGDAMFIY